MPQYQIVDRPPSNADLADAQQQGVVIILRQPNGQMFKAAGPGQFLPVSPEETQAIEASQGAPPGAGAPPPPGAPPGPPPGPAPGPPGPPGAGPPPGPPPMGRASPNVSRFTSGEARQQEQDRAGTEAGVQRYMSNQAAQDAVAQAGLGIADRAKVFEAVKLGISVEEAIAKIKGAGAPGPPGPPPGPPPGKISMMGGPRPGPQGPLAAPPGPGGLARMG